MPTETGSIDLTAQAGAAKTATDYITEITEDGIWITPSDAKPSNGQAISTTKGWHISNAMELFNGTLSVIKAWFDNTKAKIRIGPENGGRVIVSEDYVSMLKGSDTNLVMDNNGVIVGKKATVSIKPTGLSVNSVESADRKYLDVNVSETSTGSTQEMFREFEVTSNTPFSGAWIETSLPITSVEVHTITTSGATIDVLSEPTDYTTLPSAQAVALRDNAQRFFHGTGYSINMENPITLGSALSKKVVVRYSNNEYEYNVRMGPKDWTSFVVDNDSARFEAFNGAMVKENYHSLQMIDKEENTYFHVSDLRGIDGWAKVSESFILGDDRATYDNESNTIEVILNFQCTPSKSLSATVEGVTVTNVSIFENNEYPNWILIIHINASDTPNSGAIVQVTYWTDSIYTKAFTFGNRDTSITNDIGMMSVSFGEENVASGHFSHSEGYGSVASGNFSHAEGRWVTASGSRSHAEGFNSYANGDISHAEGFNSRANGEASHAEGRNTIASGYNSHAQNFGTEANKKAQTALGTFNKIDVATTTTHPSNDTDYGTYAAIIGNGTSDNARSNAAALQWDGTLELAKALPIASGGSGQIGVTTTSTVSNIITAASDITFDSAYYAQWGKVAVVTITFKTSAAKSGSWNVGTLVTGKRSAIYQRGISSSTTLTTYMGTGGTITMYGSLATNTAVAITFTYLLA